VPFRKQSKPAIKGYWGSDPCRMKGFQCGSYGHERAGTSLLNTKLLPNLVVSAMAINPNRRLETVPESTFTHIVANPEVASRAPSAVSNRECVSPVTTVTAVSARRHCFSIFVYLVLRFNGRNGS